MADFTLKLLYQKREATTNIFIRCELVTITADNVSAITFLADTLLREAPHHYPMYRIYSPQNELLVEKIL